MGAALIRKCWDVQEEKWGKNDSDDEQSNDDLSNIDQHFQNQSKNNFNNHFIRTQSI
jgi:hypothetical protein